MALSKVKSLRKRRERANYKVKQANKSNRPILYVFKSNKNIAAQIVSLTGKVLAEFSSLGKENEKNIKGKSGVEIAAYVGKGIAEKAIKADVKEVVFNKGPYMYTGRIKALADAAREGGLVF